MNADAAVITAVAGGLAALVQGLIPTSALNAGQRRGLAVGLAAVAGVAATVVAPGFSITNMNDLVTAVMVALAASQTAYALVFSKLTEWGWLRE
ncbi:MAG: hypothetical protein HW375_29 [Anaerolineales bacterium]|nr:hypothetical protein [Anaerolineales bacterium]